MIRMLTACTVEIDDVQLAVQEVLEQLSIDSELMAHSVGLITCYSEFIESGVVSALCEALPFDVIGSTTIANATNGERSLMMLCLSVLTSDDVEFATAVSDALVTEQEGPLREMYGRAREQLQKESALIVGYMPLVFHVAGDEIVAILDEACGGVPIFGTTTIDHNPDYSTAVTIRNGEVYKDRMVILVVAGDVKPRFLVAQLSEENISKQRALITAANRNLLMEVNGMPVKQYMESLGITEGGKLENVNAVPYMIDLGDGTPPLVRAIFAFTPEGYAVCGGAMPVNATLAVGSIDYVDVMRTTERMLSKIAEDQELNCVLMFSCVARFIALGVDVEAEAALVERTIPSGVPYQFAYAGGETCPVYSANGLTHNRFHNDTLIALLL